MKTILTRNGKSCLVDDDDFDRLSKYKWYAKKRFNCVYAERNNWDGLRNINVAMHREVMNFPASHKHLDHINRNGLDNRKENLRFANKSENAQNRKRYSNNTSGHKGVYRKKNRWMAEITVFKRKIGIGSFINIEDASKAYQEAALKHFGEFARIE